MRRQERFWCLDPMELAEPMGLNLRWVSEEVVVVVLFGEGEEGRFAARRGKRSGDDKLLRGFRVTPASSPAHVRHFPICSKGLTF